MRAWSAGPETRRQAPSRRVVAHLCIPCCAFSPPARTPCGVYCPRADPGKEVTMNTEGTGSTRRNFLRNGALTMGAAAATGGLWKLADNAKAATTFNVFVNAGDMTQVDGRAMHVWRFAK